MSESISPDASSIEPSTDREATSAVDRAPPASGVEGDPEPGAGPPELERRQFVRQITTDAVGLAGRLVGFSRIITRSATAAGQAMMSELGSLQAAGSDSDTGTAGDTTMAEGPEEASQSADERARAEAAQAAVPMVDPPHPPPPKPDAPVTREQVWPKVVLDAEQSAVLAAATRAIVAVNRAGFPPQLTAATVLWDGEVIRFPTLGWSRRTTQLRADPKIGLLIDDASAGVFLAVSGTAQILEAHQVRAAMEPLLRRETPDPEEAERRWQAMLADDRDRAVIVVELDQVLTGRR